MNLAMVETSEPRATMAALRMALGSAFLECAVYVCLMRLREQGLLPAGRKGRGGSALITPHQAVLGLISVSIDRRDANEAAEMARAVSSYRLHAIYPQTGGPQFRQDVPPGPRFDDWLAGRLLDTARDPQAALPGLQIEVGLGCFTIDPPLLREPPPRLRLLPADPDLAFEPDIRGTILGAPVRRMAIIYPALLHRLAALFASAVPVPRQADAVAGAR